MFTNYLRIFLKCSFHSVGVEWGLKFCISKKRSEMPVCLLQTLNKKLYVDHPSNFPGALNFTFLGSGGMNKVAFVRVLSAGSGFRVSCSLKCMTTRSYSSKIERSLFSVSVSFWFSLSLLVYNFWFLFCHFCKLQEGADINLEVQVSTVSEVNLDNCRWLKNIFWL